MNDCTMKKHFVGLYFILSDILCLPILIFGIIFLFLNFSSKVQYRFLFCDRPLLNNTHWSRALRKAGFNAEAWAVNYFSKINKKEDFDVVLSYKNRFMLYIYFIKACYKFDVFVISFYGGFLGRTLYARFEPYILKFLRKKSIIIPFGADFYSYRFIADYNRRFTLMAIYPEFGVKASNVDARIARWCLHGDIIIPGHLVEGLERWDLMPCNPIVVDAASIKKHKKNSASSGKVGEPPIKILHLSNHRLIKGTEYIEEAVQNLCETGYAIDFEVIEETQNDVVQSKMANCDILIDQIYSGYALSAIEGMAHQCIVLSNITRHQYFELLMNFSYMEECPIVSVTRNNLQDTLKTLIDNHGLRQELHKASYEYAKKYHSYEACATMFEAILSHFDGFLSRKQLLEFFHPLLGHHAMTGSDYIKHPLDRNKKLPQVLTSKETK